jgi:polyhydroxyalkanoate synthesis regulator phasin
VLEVGGSDCIGFSATRKMEAMEFLKAMVAEMKAKMDASEETMERQMGLLFSIIEVSRKTDRDQMKQEIRVVQEHIKETMET